MTRIVRTIAWSIRAGIPLLVLLGMAGRTAAQPVWTVDDTFYEHSMSVTASVQLAGRVSSGSGDLLAAFLGSEVRGVAGPTLVDGTPLFFLTVFGDSDGEVLTFEFYESDADARHSLQGDLAFEANATVGAPGAPLILTDGGAAGEIDPVSWTVSDPNSYPGQMTVLADFQMGGRPAAGEGDRMAVFAGSEIRGVADATRVGDRHLFFATVYGRRPGETLDVRFYDVSEGAVHEQARAMTFLSGAVLGDLQVPLSWSFATGGDDAFPRPWISPAVGTFPSSMSIVATVQSNGVEVTAQDDSLAAFVDGEIRGVAAATAVEEGMRFFLAVEGEGSGPAVVLRYLHGATGSVLPISDALEFLPDDIRGSPSDPVILGTTFTVPPQPTPDAVTVPEDGSVIVPVLDNDVDADGGELVVTALGDPEHGVVVLVAGTVTYTPEADYHGPDQFAYAVEDGQGGSGSSEVRVTVLPVNDGPVARSDSASVAAGDTVDVIVLANDTDIDGDELVVSDVSLSERGVVPETLPDGTLRYAASMLGGIDTFQYTVSDPSGAFATAIVTVEILATRGFDVVPSGTSVQVSEAGTSDSLGVVLTAQPVSDVVLTVTSSDLSEFVVSPDVLRFGSADWAVVQTVVVTGVDDDLIDGDQVADVVVAVSEATSDPAFADVPDFRVPVTTTDDDGAGLLVVESDGSTQVSESGTTDTFTVALTSRPFLDVVLKLEVSDPGEASVLPSLLRFTPEAWSELQIVTVSGVDDADLDGDQQSTIRVSVDVSASDPIYGNLEERSVFVTTVDDDAPGFSVIETNGSTVVEESGSIDRLSVVLTARPEAEVELSVVTSLPAESTVNPSTLVFAPDAWSTAQWIEVAGVDDDIVDGDQESTLTIAVARTDDAAFLGLAPKTVLVTTIDDDVPGLVVSESELRVDESGATASFEVALSARPVTPVFIRLLSSDPGEATVTPALMEFTADTWSVSQTATVQGVPDDLRDGEQIATVTLSVDEASSDTAFGSVPPFKLLVTVESVNNPPDAADDTAETPEDTPVSIAVLTNDTDAEAGLDPESVLVTEPPEFGSAEPEAGGTVRYTPPPDYHGSDQFAYSVADLEGDRATAQVTVLITPVNDPPVVVLPPASFQIEFGQDSPLEYVVSDLAAVFADVDSPSLTFGASVDQAAPFTVSVSNRGIVTAKFAERVAGRGVILATATDGEFEASASFEIESTIAELPANLRPYFDAVESVSLEEGEVVAIALRAKDPEGSEVALFLDDTGGIPEDRYTFEDSGGGHGTLTWATGAGDAGSYTPVFRAFDSIMDGYATASIIVLPPSDQNPPMVEFLSPEDGALLSTATPTISASLTDPEGSLSPDAVSLQVDGVLVTGFSLSASGELSYTPSDPLAEGDHALFLRAADAAGHSSSATRAFTVKTQIAGIDVSPVDPWTTQESIDLSGTTEPDLNLALLVDGNVIAQVVAGDQGRFVFTDVFLSEGEHRIQVSGQDAAGNTGESQELQVSRDTQSPTLAIVGPSGVISTAEPVLEIVVQDAGSGTDMASVRLKLDEEIRQEWSAQGDLVRLPLHGLGDGFHSISVSAADNLGNQAPIVLERFQVDTVSPTARHPFLDGAVEEEISNAQPLISIPISDPLPASGVDPGSILLSLDGSPLDHTYLPQAREIRFDAQAAGLILPDGRRVLTLELSDRAGNRTSLEGAFRIDSSVQDEEPPFLDNPEPAPGSNSTGVDGDGKRADDISFVLADLDAGPDLNSVSVALDSGFKIPLRTADRLPGGERFSVAAARLGSSLTEGSHTVVVTGADRRGNVAELAWQFFIDRTPPDPPTIPSELPTFTNEPVITVPVEVAGDAVSGDSTVTVRVLVNGELASERLGRLGHRTEVSGVVLAGGANTLTAQIVDAAGNESRPSMRVLVVLDVEAPTVSDFRNLLGALSSDSRPVLIARVRDRLSGINPDSLRLFFNGSPVALGLTWDFAFGALEAALAFDLPNGTHVAGLRISDNAGNVRVSSTSFTIARRELATPTGLVLGGATSEYVLALSGIKDPGDGVQILLDGTVAVRVAPSDQAAFSVRKALPSLAPRSVVSVRSVDAAGNRSEEVVAGVLISDVEPPWIVEKHPTAALIDPGGARVEVLLEDSGTGVDPNGIRMTIAGEQVTPTVVVEADGAVRVRFDDAPFFDALARGPQLAVVVEAQDRSVPANRLTSRWYFGLKVNAPPVWAPIPRFLVQEDRQLTVDLGRFASDPDHDLTLLRITPVSTDTSVAARTEGAILTVMPRPDYNRAGVGIRLDLEDPIGSTASTFLTVDVSPVNDPPRFQTGPDTLNVARGDSVQAVFSAEDPDIVTNGDYLIYSLIQAPAGAAIDSLTGRFEYLAGPDAISSTLTVSVSDRDGAADTTSVYLSVLTSTSLVQAADMPAAYDLGRPFPNPASIQARIPFDVPRPGHVRIAVFDVLGREMARLVDQVVPPGHHQVTWATGRRASGLYFFRMTAEGHRLSRSVVVVR